MSVDNSDIDKKLAIRRLIANEIAGDVVDAYSGEGVMAKKAWKGRGVLRIDRKRLPGIDKVGDNMALAVEAAATGRFHVFDLDAYGNPWPLFLKIAKSIPSGRYGFAITCGIRRSLVHKNAWAQGLLGLPKSPSLNLLPFYDDIVNQVLHACGMTVSHVKQASPDKTGLTVRYFGVLAEKGSEPATNRPAAQDNHVEKSHGR